ncbi:hypothetical protein DPMN_164571 [Dreissena polymorpha]|uniref:Uncharacterized protein n=2 Tax=Dreissena polymorpha TaxID=45954 RepID=A0A9D4EVF9_DREPO|nr:hypothetical protein DPMN_164571 [Dreissena polymorpha]
MQRFQACRLLTLRRRLMECNRILDEIAHILVHSFNEPIVKSTSPSRPTGQSTNEELIAIYANATQLLLETKLILDFSYYAIDQSNITNLLRMLSKELRRIVCSIGYVLRSGEITVQDPRQAAASGVICNASVELSFDPALLRINVGYINILANNVEKYIEIFSQSVVGLNSLLEIDQEE